MLTDNMHCSLTKEQRVASAKLAIMKAMSTPIDLTMNTLQVERYNLKEPIERDTTYQATLGAKDLLPAQ